MIIVNSIPIMMTRFPFISTFAFVFILIAFIRAMQRTKLIQEGLLCIAVISLIYGACMLIEMELSLHKSGRCKYEAVFINEKPEDVLDVYEIVGQRGNIYILEDRLY